MGRNFGLGVDNYARDPSLDYFKNSLIFGSVVGLASLVVGGVHGFSKGEELVQNVEFLSQAPDFIKYSIEAISALSIGSATGLLAFGVGLSITFVGQYVLRN